jgi:hypothetical protein
MTYDYAEALRCRVIERKMAFKNYLTRSQKSLEEGDLSLLELWQVMRGHLDWCEIWHSDPQVGKLYDAAAADIRDRMANIAQRVDAILRKQGIMPFEPRGH